MAALAAETRDSLKNSGGVAAITARDGARHDDRLDLWPEDAGRPRELDERMARLVPGDAALQRKATRLDGIALKRATARGRPIGQEIVHFGQRGNLALEAEAHGHCDR